MNPDGKLLGSPHIHTYREGYGDKWASTLPSNVFTKAANRHKTFDEFLSFCNVVEPPYIRWGLTA